MKTLTRLLLPLLCLAAAPAAAHEFWLAPSRFAPAPGAPVAVGAIAGTGFRGEPKPYAPPHVKRLTAHAARVLDLVPAASFGDVVWARFAPADGGGALLAYESDFTPIRLPAAQFDAYLRDEGLDVALAERVAHPGSEGRERYRRCAKLWLAGTDVARATSVEGLPLEIVALSAPGDAAALRVRVLWQGRALAGVRLKSWCTPLAGGDAGRAPATRDSVACAAQYRTDARGEATIACATRGEWLVSAVHMEPSADRSVADWESTWASLTFARLAGREAQR